MILSKPLTDKQNVKGDVRMSQGVHVHVHCEESVLDGLSTVEELVLKAKSLGHSALGITDHGVCSAIPDFITACEKQWDKATSR